METTKEINSENLEDYVVCFADNDLDGIYHYYN